MSALHRKLLRDLERLWAQALAIALVMAAGVATLILGIGAHASLSDTRAAYYEANRFADLFADVTRAPRSLGPEIEAIEGVQAADLRIVKLALLDMPDMEEPGAVFLVSAPSDNAGGLNRLHLRSGRLPDPQAPGEVAVSEGFAVSHGLRPGDRFAILMNGQRRSVTVTGVALSPEFIYALGPGDLMPDERRFGIVWMPRTALEAAYDLEGAFSNLVVKLTPGASAERVAERIDALLDRYGGTGAVGRKDQVSHAFLDAELTQLSAMSRVLPPIFLAVAAFLVNMTLSRLVLLEREQIGLLKAIGYSARAVALHYVEFVALIAVIGIAIGFAAGTWLGHEIATMYARFFNFPFLVFSRSPEPYAIAALVTLLAAVAGAAGAARRVARLPPAVAMAPPAPAQYRKATLGRLFGLASRMRQLSVMVARHLLHAPVRTAASVLGVALAVAVLVGSMWSFGSVETMIDVTFRQSDRQDATISFAGPRPAAALHAVRAMPGVLAAEPFRAVAVRMSHGSAARRLALTGKPAAAELSRVLDRDMQVMTLPGEGLVLSEVLAGILGVRTGEEVLVEVLEGDRRTVAVPVSGISLGYLGLNAFMSLEALNRLLGEGAMISGAHVVTDPAEAAAFNARLKATPQAGFVVSLTRTLQRFRDTIAENISRMVGVYVALAAIIAFGVVYNFSRISLSEQGRELASLRVLGFTRAEVAGVLFWELAVIVAVAQPVGWAIGYGFAAAMAAGFSSELYRVPLVVGREVYAWGSAVVLVASLASGLLVRGRIDRLDMIEVLKTRE